MEGQALVLRLSPLSLMTQHTSTLGRGKRQFGEGREGEDGEGSRAFAAKRPGDDADGGPWIYRVRAADGALRTPRR